MFTININNFTKNNGMFCKEVKNPFIFMIFVLVFASENNLKSHKSLS